MKEYTKILDRLKDIELQLKAVWWDNLIYFLLLAMAGISIIAVLTNWILLKLVCVLCILMSIVAFVALQFAEKIELNKIRKKYEKLKGVEKDEREN